MPVTRREFIQRFGIMLASLLAARCAIAPPDPMDTPTGMPVSPTATSTLTPIPAPVGKVEPPPRGCLYMEFFSPSDDSACRRDQSGRIIAVITPVRNEPLLKQWALEEFEEVVYNDNGNSPNSLHLPGVMAWEYLKGYLQPEDEIWTFGVLDTGFVIIQDNSVLCLVVMDHQL